jgi:hypothetical protein
MRNERDERGEEILIDGDYSLIQVCKCRRLELNCNEKRGRSCGLQFSSGEAREKEKGRRGEGEKEKGRRGEGEKGRRGEGV